MTKESEDQEAVVQHGDLPRFALDRELRYTSFNQAHAAVMKSLYGAQIALGGRLPDYQTVATDRETSTANLERALGGERVVASAFSGEPGRDRRYFDVVHTPQLDAGGAIVGVEVIAFDVTERQNVEDSLRESDTMRDIAENVARVGSWSWTPGTQKVSWSPEMYRLFDIDRDGFDGDIMPVLQARVHPDDLPGLLEVTAKVSTDGVARPVEYRVVHRDGSEHILHSEGTSQRSHAEGPATLYGYYQDVTDQRLAEATLRESEARYRGLFEHSLFGAAVHQIVLDEDGRPVDYVFLEANPAFEAATGLRTADIVGRRVTEVLPGIEESPFIEIYGRVAISGKPATFVQYAQPLERYYSVSAYSVGGGRFATLFEDVTDRRRAEEEIHRLNAELEERVQSRTAQLEATNKELEAFAYSVSHDLRAPLRAIDGFSQAVLEDAEDRLSEEDVHHLQRVRGAARRMAVLIDDLLGLSRIGRQEIQLETVDVSALAEEVLAELREMQPDRRVETVVEEGLTARADPVLLRVILANLLGNAWKFTSKHPTARVEVGSRGAGADRAFYVRDDGAGFAPKNAANLFGAFQRMHSPGEFEGNGIGLATVQRLVARHGGRVWAEAEVEQGATFYFTLPEPSTDA